MSADAARVVLAGNNLAACRVLDLLLGALPAADVLAIAPAVESHEAWQGSLAPHAAKRGVACLEPADLNAPDAVAAIADFRGDLLLSIYYAQAFDAPLLAAVAGPAINMHPSLLPRHRGVAPIIWAIAEGDRMTGLSAHLKDRGDDSGPLLLQRSMPIHREDTGYDVHLKMVNLVRGLAARILRRFLLDRSLPEPRAQAGRATYHGAADPPLNHLVYDQPAERIRNIVRALAPPLPGAFSYAGSERVTLGGVSPLAATAIGPPRPAGMLQRTTADEVVVWTADGPLRIDSVGIRGEWLHGAGISSSAVLDEGVVLS